VDCDQDCDVPFLLRAVNGAGSNEDQRHGGFYSPQFWIDPIKTSSTSTITIGTTSTTRPTTSVVVLGGQAQSFPTTSDLAPTALPSDPAQDMPEPSSQRGGALPQETETTSKDKDNNHTAVGVGVGIGVGVSFALVGIFVLWRRYRRKKETQSKRQEMFASGLGFQGYPHQGWEMSQPQEKRPHVYAERRTMVAEAPAYPMSPRELAARNSHPPRGIGTNTT
jgi:hypothetical protein